jgi:HK97 family phage major capsid protein
MKKSQKLKKEMEEKWSAIKKIRDQVVAEAREFKQEERDLIEKSLDEVRQIELAIEKEQKEEKLIERINEVDHLFDGGQEGGRGQKGNPQPGPGGQTKQAAGSIGQRFAESEGWKSWLKQVAPNGRIPDSSKGLSSPPVNVGDLGLFRKELLTGVADVSAGALVESERTGIYESIGRYPLTLRDLISIRQTMSDTVEFVRQTTQVAQAAPTPEANVATFSGATGEISGQKPEGTMRFERVQEVVKTIAVWIPATKRALSDAGQLRGLIDDELRSDTNEELEDQLLNGDGTGESFTGLANTSGVLVQAFVTDIVATARKAITNLLINGRQVPTAYLFNPQDWESFDLIKDDQGRYYWGGPMAQGMRTLWGVPVAQSFFQTQGTGWLANWRKMVLWDRMQAMISVSDSHADFFIRNMVAILCELRAAMGVIRPTGFVEIDLTSGS